ncbi:hypothetical protein [Mycobacterium haemophilum]
MLDTTAAPRGNDGVPAFVITANGTRVRFGIDDDAFTAWIAGEGDELARHLPTLGDASPGSTLSDLVYRALSADVLVGDPGIELNIHGHDDGAGYFLRLNNRGGRQLLVGLTRGRHELSWLPKDLTPSEGARRYLQEICDVANALLNDLLVAPRFPSIGR